MTNRGSEVRLLAVVSPEMCEGLTSTLRGADVALTCGTKATDVGHLIRQDAPFEVVMLPAAFPETEWWVLWGELSPLEPRPAILVYAHVATFQLWSSVLESGGYDVITEPFVYEELVEAIYRAAQSFRLQ